MTAPSAQIPDISPDAITEAWKASESPKRLRDLAASLNASEGMLLASLAACPNLGDRDLPLLSVQALRTDFFEDLLKGLSEFSSILAITRNEDAVHEKPGACPLARNVHGPVWVINSLQIDLRIIRNHWKRAFFVSERGRSSDAMARKSFQIFDAAGDSVFKAYLKEESDVESAAKLADSLKASSDEAFDRFNLNARRAAVALVPEDELDVETLHAGWLALDDTHNFMRVLQKLRLGRAQAFRLAPEGLARRLAPSAIEEMLKSAAASGLSIMSFVENPGCIQIHTGPISKVVNARGWLNILDEGFNLHLRPEGIAEVWEVRKPTDDGIVTSVDMLAADGHRIGVFFGERKPGKPELEAWRKLAGSLPAFVE